MLRKNGSIFVLVFILALLLSSCGIFNTNSNSDMSDNNSTGNTVSSNPAIESNADVIDENGIRKFVSEFIDSLYQQDSNEFKKLVNDDGIYSITYFVDQRDTNSVVYTAKDSIRDDLVLCNKDNKGGITLQTMMIGGNNFDVSEMPIINNEDSKKLGFNIDWKSKDETKIQNNIKDIVNMCQKINMLNNKWITQVFVLKDNTYALANSSGVLDPSPEFTGDWVIFEKIDDKYKVRAVMQLQ